MSNLKQLIYTSQSDKFTDVALMRDLIERARRNNKLREITGVLLHDNNSIIQVLEGEVDRVNTLFARILRDPRHSDVVLIMERPIPVREFEDWSMGYAEAPTCRDEIRTSFTSTFSGTTEPLRPTGRASRVLDHFASGGWR